MRVVALLQAGAPEVDIAGGPVIAVGGKLAHDDPETGLARGQRSGDLEALPVVPFYSALDIYLCVRSGQEKVWLRERFPAGYENEVETDVSPSLSGQEEFLYAYASHESGGGGGCPCRRRCAVCHLP
jgi:hypothetical protein